MYQSQIIILWGKVSVFRAILKLRGQSEEGEGVGKSTVGHVTKGRLYAKCPFLFTRGKWVVKMGPRTGSC